MITVHPAQTLSYLTRAEPSLPVTPLDSVTSHVIALFQSRLTDAQAGPAPTHLKGPGAQTQQRIEHLLRFAIAPEQPSLAEQISKLIENTPSPLTDQSLSNKVAALLNQPSALDSQKTYKELIRQLLEDSPTSAPNIRAVRPRVPRHALDAHSATAPHTSPVRQFADALVDRGDRQLAMNIANSLVRQRLAFESGDDADVDGKAAIPPDSTFGQALGELGDALNSEPFKSFAETHLIDISNAAFTTSGDLYDFKDGKIKQYSLARDSEWAAASAAVLAALKKVCKGHFVGIHGYDRNYAPAAQVAWFYGMEQGNIRGSETLSNINQLMRNGTFNALSNTDPLYAKHYAPIKQRQRDASQRIADLPLPQLKQRLAEFAPPSVSQNVQEADRAIAEQCNRGLLKLLLNPQDSDYESPVMLKEIPEYSTFNQARKNLLTALTGSVFTTFAQDNQIDPTSISIHPITGELNGKKKGIETTISLNDISGWSDVWEEVRDAVQQMAAGSDTPVQYPTPSSAKLNDILNFYHEPVPRQLDASQTNWQRLNLVSVLERSDALANNHGFNALINSDADDTRSTAVRESQQTIIRQLAGTSVPLSPLETLAAAVAPRVDTQVEPEDASASAESALAVAVHRVMLELNTNPTGATSKMIEPIPANSLFGQWWAQLGNALKGRGLAEWARQESVELASLRFDPVEKALFGKVNGFDQRFPLFAFANTYPEYLDALTAVTNAAQALAANGKPLTLSLSLDNRAPYEYVSSFYGIDNSNFASPAFAASTALIGRTQNFPEHVQNPAKSLEQLHRQKTALGDSNDRHALINQLKHASIENDDTTRFVVDPNSSYQPKGVTTVKSFLAGQGLYGVSQPAETENLLKALQTPMPQSPPLGNSWGFLSTPAPSARNSATRSTSLLPRTQHPAAACWII
ncbi:hypothetical protein LRS56_12910 [Pseudomonas poae]|nr:hypothetical protein LRS56_12910 [Pseudomonas poae]